MKQIFILLAFSLISLFVSAQFEDIDLSDYKLPDIKRHQLDFNFSANQSGTHNYKPENTNPTFDFEGDYSIDYNYYFNTRKKIINFDLSGTGNLKLDREKEDKIAWGKNDRLNFHTNTGYSLHYYFNEDNFYLNLNPTLDFSFYNYHNLYPDIVGSENTGNDKSNRMMNYLSANAGVGIGYGRIEPVTDLRHSIYILEDLLKNESLERIPNKEEIFAVANKISELKNKRFFDHRLRKIYELKSLDSLLNDMDLIKSSDAVYFTSLNDFWINFSESRYNGSEIGVVLVPGTRFEWEKDVDKSSGNEIINKNTENQVNSYFGGEFYFNNHKPIGLEWQRFLSLNTRLSKSFSNYSTNEYDSQNVHYSINYIYGYSWYLSTRTKFSFDFQGKYSSSVNTNKSSGEEGKHKMFDQYFHLNLYYYISPQLRFSFNNGVYFNFMNSDLVDDMSKLNFSSNIGFTYMIF